MRRTLVLLLAVLTLAFTPAEILAVDLPLRPAGYVSDFVGILSKQQRQELEVRLKEFEQQTSTEIAVIITKSFQGLDRFSYSQELFTKWGIGKRGKDNGVLFLVGPEEGKPFPQHGEAFINVGRGLEGALPDSLTGSILRNEVFPEFRSGNIAAGIIRGVDAIMQASRGEYSENVSRANEKRAPFFIHFLDIFLWIAFVVLTWLGSFLARSESFWLGGVLGAGLGLVLGLVFLAGLMVIYTTIGLGLLGALFDHIVSRNYKLRKARGQPTDFWHSGGGFWFGGGRGGFGGGGGFGGFGGGGSGGGGAGGSW